jgi:hypothetical protein
MGFEIFNRKVVWTGTPSITFTKLGRISFNKAASSLIEKNAIENVLLLWDAEKKIIGIRSTAKKDRRTYTVYSTKRGDGCGFSATTFFKWIGYDLSESRSLATQWDEHNQIFTVELPSGCIKNNGTITTNEDKHTELYSDTESVKLKRRKQPEEIL